MNVDTLKRALTAVREKIAAADQEASEWLAERDRRRRQEAAFLRGIVRIEGSQRKAAIVTGISQATISRTLDPQGYEKKRERDAVYRQTASAKPLTVGQTPPAKLRRRSGWQPHEPNRHEMDRWYQQYLGWTKTSQAQARMLVFNSTGRLPDAAYYTPNDTSRESSLGAQGGPAESAD
jgi:predicted DNA-binding protein (UPF0251 family)